MVLINGISEFLSLTYRINIFYRSMALMSSANPFISRGSCDEIGDRLNDEQLKVCKVHINAMDSVKYGAIMAVSECQHQFRHRRWNCTTVQFDRSPVFGNQSTTRGELYLCRSFKNSAVLPRLNLTLSLEHVQ